MTDPQAHPDPSARSTEPEPTTQSDLLHQPDEAFEPEWPSEMPDEAGAEDFGEPVVEPHTVPLHGCTVAVREQLPAARVLRDSFLRSHPGGRFTILLPDWPGALREHERDEVLTPTELGMEPVEFARLATACTAGELRAVLRPRLLAGLLESGATVLYLEPSVQVFAGFDDVLAGLGPQQPVALAPRVLRPLLVDGLRPSATDLAESGTFDPNLLAVCSGAEQFLALWAEQVRADPSSAASFLEGLPALVDHRVLRDPGVGLSVFNAGQRTVDATEENRYLVDGHVLRSVHFDGFEPQRPWLLSATYAERPRVLLSEHPQLARLCAGYRNALVARGHTQQQPHPFDHLPDGSAIPAALRAEYRRAWRESEHTGEHAPTSPFEPVDSGGDPVDSFLEWACAPGDERQRMAGSSRWAAALWADDPLLQRDYPEPFGNDAAAFREWCAGVGAASGRLPSRALGQPAGEQRSPMVDQLGVAVLGTGRLAELLRVAARTSGLPSADTADYPVVLRCDSAIPVPSGRHVVDVLPDGGPAGAAHTSGEGGSAETWVLSEASRRAARRAGRPAGRVLTPPLPDPGEVDLPTRKGARARQGLSEEFVIGAFGDHADERQGNILGLVNTFFAAFPERGDVRLLIAVTGVDDHPEAAERLRLATAADPRITLLEGPGVRPDDDPLATVLSASDCVASLNRMEGGAGGDRYALNLLDAAARGIPVVAGDHGAVAEMLGPDGAKLVPCHHGGEPDIDSAAALLTEVVNSPDGMVGFATAARQHVLAEHSPTRAGEALRDRVEQAYRSWRAKWSQDRNGPDDDPLRPLLVARHALHRPPEVGVGRNAMTPALRKAVLKALGHYDEHIRDIMRSLLDGVEQTAGELLRRQHDSGGEPGAENLRGELEQLGRRQDELGAQLSGSEDGMVRVRGELADQHRRLSALEQDLGGGGGDERFNALAERIDHLTGAVERTLDRVDRLEKQWQETGRSQQEHLEHGMRRATQDADHALRATDVVQRILLREHERNNASDDGDSTPVLCEAGLLRLPAGDGRMLPWLSSHSTWESEVSRLIDSLLEPDGVFLDVGAYVGYQTVRVLSRFGNSAAVVAVEPCEHARQLLGRNADVNVGDTANERLTVLESAAWDSAGELAVEPSVAGGVHVHEPAAEEDSDTEQATGSSVVPGVRLDDELEALPALDGLGLSVVHVDVGAGVHRILRGLVRLLRRDRPSVVCSFTPSAIEQLGDDPADVLHEFETWGYDLIPVGRSQVVSVADLLEAVGTADSAATVKLWLHPREAAA